MTTTNTQVNPSSADATSDPSIHRAAPLMQLAVSGAAQSWLASALIHMVVLVVMALVLGTIHVARTIGRAPEFTSVEEIEPMDSEFERFLLDEPPLEPTELSPATLTLTAPPEVAAVSLDASPSFESGSNVISCGIAPLGEGDSPTINAEYVGSMLRSPMSATLCFGGGDNMGGAESLYSRQGQRKREGVIRGGTKQSERSVAAAINWLARHQRADGSWSIDHTSACRGGICSCAGTSRSDAGATALGLLPFLAAGQTHVTKGIYQRNVLAAVDWLMRHQKTSGDLSQGQSQTYAHGLATIALCEAYGMTQDLRVGLAAQAALNLIQTNQNAQGSWRYSYPSQDSDTSVYGWQVMALKSGQMAGLKVDGAVLEGCRKYLTLCDSGKYGSEFGYTPGRGGSAAMTGVGLLASQYLGAERSDPVVTGGVEYLSRHLPKIDDRDIYYWYYATQVMHNVPGPQWDTWNRQMRRVLIETQERSGCATGSWNPERPVADRWGKHGGRLMVTSLSCLTLEVYYRYLPLYKLEDAEKALEKL